MSGGQGRRLSCYLLPGRVTEPADVLRQARDAEAAGFDGVWISERLDLKEIGVLVGAAAAVTDRITIGSGLTHLGTRNSLVLAALAATAQSLSGGRFVLGLGRGMPMMEDRLGTPRTTLAALEAFPPFLVRLWRGARITDSGPLGTFHRARFVDLPAQPPPPTVLGTIGPRAFEVAARSYDAVLLHPLLTVAATERCVRRIRAIEREVHRDRPPVRIIATLLTSPDLPDEVTDEIIRARALTYLQPRPLGDALVRLNGWNPALLDALRSHGALNRSGFADMRMTRRDLAGVGHVVPDEWVTAGCAVGSARFCAGRVAEYWAAGVDEVLVHGALPGQAAGVVRWARAAQAGEVSAGG